MNDYHKIFDVDKSKYPYIIKTVESDDSLAWTFTDVRRFLITYTKDFVVHEQCDEFTYTYYIFINDLKLATMVKIKFSTDPYDVTVYCE